MARLSDRRVLSPICEVVWCGWRTTTLHLQQAGWEIAVEGYNYDFTTRLLLRHRMLDLYGVTKPVELHRFDMRNTRGPVFEVVNMTSKLSVVLPQPAFDFRQIDARPQMAEFSTQEISGFNIFATPLARTEEIIVDPQDVSAMLEQIRSMQAPAMKEIRDRDRRRDREQPAEREIFHAQILSIAA